MGSSLRELSKVQAQDGLTVSAADDLDKQVQDLLDTYNGLLPRHLTRRWLQSLFVMGQDCSVPSLNVQDQLPWLLAHNDTQHTVSGAAPPGGFQNVLRVKGAANPYIDYGNLLLSTDYQYMTTTSFAVTQPCVIEALSLLLRTDDTFDNTFNWFGAGRPADKAINDPLDDLVLEIAVDSPFDPERRASNASVFKRRRFFLDAEFFSGLAIPGGATDMVPAFPSTPVFPRGVCVDARHLGILVPRNGRVRFSVVIPQYRATYNSNGWQRPGTRPWGSQCLSGTLVLLEPTVR